MDDGTHEVAVVPRLTLRNLGNLSLELLLKLGPERLGDIESRGGTALLTLVLKGTSDGLDDGVVNLSRGVDQVEVLATSLTDDSGVGSESALSDTIADGTIQLTENSSATSVVQGSEFLVCEDSLGHLHRVTGNKLDDILGKTGLDQDLVHEPAGGNGVVTGLPDNNVTQQSRGTSQVSGNGREVEGGHGVHETLERAVLRSVPDSGSVVLGLLSVQLLGVGNAEAEEISQLSGGVDLGLPGILALAKHGGGHDIIAVLGGDQVGSLEKDGSTIRKGKSLPLGLGSQGGFDSLGNIGRCRGVVRSDGRGVIGRVKLLRQARSLDLL